MVRYGSLVVALEGVVWCKAQILLIFLDVVGQERLLDIVHAHITNRRANDRAPRSRWWVPSVCGILCTTASSIFNAGSLHAAEVYAEQDGQAEGKLEDELSGEQSWLDREVRIFVLLDVEDELHCVANRVSYLDAQGEDEGTSDDAETAWEVLHDFLALFARRGIGELAPVARAPWSSAVNTPQRSNDKHSATKRNKLDDVEGSQNKNDEDFLPGMQNLIPIVVMAFIICINSHSGNYVKNQTPNDDSFDTNKDTFPEELVTN